MRRTALASSAIACLLLAGCGSKTKPLASSGTGYSDFLAFSKCMRGHGISGFPDPSAQGGIHLAPGSGLGPASPRFQAAQEQCKKLLPGGGPGPQIPVVSGSDVAFARCMRANGVPNYPDPTAASVEQPPVGVNLASPAVERAEAKCGGGGGG
jgi:hypothetical protein